MKGMLKNNIGLKILALFFAVILWWVVVNEDDPIDTKQYTVAVTVTNPEVITNEGQSFQIIEDTSSVKVTVKARRKVLDKIRPNNIVATADLRELQGSSVPIRIKIDGYEGMYEEVSANPRNIQVRTENIQKKTFPITATYYGIPRDGYVVGNLMVKPQTVDVSGPASTIEKISKVVAGVDVSELSKGTTIETTLIYYDAADDIIDQTLLTSNCDKNGVSVEVVIWETKFVEIQFDTSKIEPASGYVFSGIEIEPQKVEVTGSPNVLDLIQTLEVGAEALAKKNLSKNEEVMIDLIEYLPEGITIVEENTTVAVRIILEEEGTKSILLPVGAVTVQNAPKNLQLSYGPEQEVELKFSGSADVLKDLTSDKIVATIDLEEYAEQGTYDVSIQITDLPKGCSYIGKATVQIVLSKKTD